ncbi:uncharacterized protein YALI1_F35882g [Yarrowia lipolytica]|uniref:Uncharacterized protein n=1 Tax=Yarrowia lipolytica TaxID=4952 RepID=A0A1D8NQB4_YARLL|nr:hypothetical protein YALI1_F35882g [Yarrowia lipolytica]
MTTGNTVDRRLLSLQYAQGSPPDSLARYSLCAQQVSSASTHISMSTFTRLYIVSVAVLSQMPSLCIFPYSHARMQHKLSTSRLN